MRSRCNSWLKSTSIPFHFELVILLNDAPMNNGISNPFPRPVIIQQKMTTMVTLSCLLNGEPLSKTFRVEIDECEAVRHLKELIEERARMLWGPHVNSNDLALHKASIGDKDEGALRNFYLELDQGRRDTLQLHDKEIISDTFSNHGDESLHVIVERTGESLPGTSAVPPSRSIRYAPADANTFVCFLYAQRSPTLRCLSSGSTKNYGGKV